MSQPTTIENITSTNINGKAPTIKTKTTKPKQPALEITDRLMVPNAIQFLDQGLISPNVPDEDGNIDPNKVKFNSAQSFGSIASSRGKLPQSMAQIMRNAILVTNTIKRENGLQSMILAADTFKDSNLSAEIALQCTAYGDGQGMALFSEAVSKMVNLNSNGDISVERTLSKIDNGLLQPDYNEHVTGIKPLKAIENVSKLFYNKTSPNGNEKVKSVFTMNHLTGHLEFCPSYIPKPVGLDEFMHFIDPKDIPALATDFKELKNAANNSSKSANTYIVSQQFMKYFNGIFFDYGNQYDDQRSDCDDDDDDDGDNTSSDDGDTSDGKSSHEEDASEVETSDRDDHNHNDNDDDDDERSQENEAISDEQNEAQTNTEVKNTASSSSKTKKQKKNKDKKQPTPKTTKKRKHDSTSHNGETATKKSKK